MNPEEQDQQPPGLALRDIFVIFRTHWLGITVIVVASLLLAGGWTLTQPKVYAADSTGIVSASTGQADDASVNSALVANSLAKSKVTDYVSVASSRAVAERVIQAQKLDTTPEALVSHVTITAPEDTAQLKVEARGGTPQSAQRLADAWVTALAAEIKNLEGGDSAMVTLVPLAGAALPTAPISPDVKLALVVGLLAGLVLAIAYALIRNVLDRRIRSVDTIERGFGLAVVGTIPRDQRLDGGSRVVESGIIEAGMRSEDHAMSEALRELRTNLTFMNVDNPPRIIVVTSSVPSEGKSTLTANLAVTIASSGQRVVVVDADLRRPTVTEVFGLVKGPGTTDVLRGRASAADIIQQWDPELELFVLGAGTIPPNPSELLGSQAMAALLKDLASEYFVLVDAPPLLPVTDAAVLTKAADGALIVVSAGKTTQDQLAKSLSNLSRVGGHVLGVIFNRVPRKSSSAYQYGYYGGGYSYGSSREGAGPAAAEYPAVTDDATAPTGATTETGAPGARPVSGDRV